MKNLCIFTLCILFSIVSYAQTLVNQSVPDTLGTPNVVFEYTKIIPIGNGNFAILDNDYNSGFWPTSQGFNLAEVNPSTGPVGSFNFFAQHGEGDYGTNISVYNGYLYAVGLTTDSLFNNSISCNLYKINLSTFDTVFTLSMSVDSAVQQAPFSVLADDSGYIYMGASVQTASGYKIALLKFDSIGNEIWESNWDTSGWYTLPVAMAFSGGYINITGFSFDGAGHSNFLSLPVNSHTGGQLLPRLSANGIGTVSHPIGIVPDTLGNSYIAGTSTVAGTTSIVKVVAYDNSFSQLWVSTYGDSSQTNTAASMCGDQPGNHIFVTGTSPNTSGGTNLTVTKFNSSDGSLAWSRTLSAPNPANGMSGVGITNSRTTGNIYVTGTVYNGVDTNIVTAAYDTAGNLLWMKTFARTGSSTDVPYSITTGDGGTPVYVTARSYASDSLYIMLEYDEFTKTNTLNTTSGGGQYVADQIIVRFDPGAVNQDAVNNLDINFAPPSYWLTATADSALQANVPFDLTTCTMERIYKGLKTTYRYSIARNGDTIPIPPLWAAFLLIYPDQGKSEEVGVAQGINTLFPMVVHTGLNYVGQFMSGSSCYNLDPRPLLSNDPYLFSTGGTNYGQTNLWTDSFTTNCNTFYDIDIDSAWQLETGKSYIKVGIYDSGLDGLNEDFCPSPIPTGNPGGKANGWDFYNNISLPQESWTNADAPTFAHGTMISGIIGAIRNNHLDVAGIAGGSYIDTTDVGVTLYGMKISHDSMYAGGYTQYGLITMPITDLCNALTMGCTYTDSGYGFGLHVINCSWGFMTDSSAVSYAPPPRGLNDMELGELELAFKNVYRNQTTVVAAAGNNPMQTLYPANFYGDWILCVGGASDTGTWYTCGCTGATTNYVASYIGACVDVIAPSFSDPTAIDGYFINTTDYHTGIFPTQYQGITHNFDGAFGGTSFATAHVTGTVALLMSYLNSPYSIYQNLSPEDAEHMIIRNADNRGYIGHSDNTGWGLLNAGGTLQDVNKGCRQLVHRNAQPDLISPIYVLQKSHTPISLTENYTNLDGQTFDTSLYICDVYKCFTTVSNSLPSSYDILDYWTRGSSTHLLLAYDSVSNKLEPFEHLYVDSISNASTTISGFYYKVYKAADTSFIGYWGMDSMYLLGVYPTFGYTLLLNNPSTACNPTDTTTNIREIQSHTAVSFYPNPTNDVGELVIFTDKGGIASINIVAMEGQSIQSVYDGELSNGNTNFPIDVSKLASGIYMLTVDIGGQKNTIKFSKYE